MKIESYDLDLDVDFPQARVVGTVGITIQGSRSPLSLDCATLKIRSVKVNGKPVRFVLDKPHSKLKVYSVPKGRSLVQIHYEKQVSDETIFGLYKAKYGQEYMLTTDLEPIEARTVFPCVDEPLYKAVFRLRITTQKGLSAISNTPTARVELAEGGKTRFVFEETPPMSTYLLFFTVGKLEELRTNSGHIEVITATRPGQSKDSRFVLDVVADVLADYQKYFDVPYPLPKLHVVAVPEYHTGAMENWGAIASRESRVLINEDSAFSDRALAAGTMVHEVGHMWFGDLVTMKWWDDLWLNESFATLVEYKMLDRIRPEFKAWDMFLRNETFPAVTLDALSTTHPIQVRIKKAEEANQFFDIISYNKGAAILRMLEAYAGEEAFRKGVSNYLKKYSYSNATGEDLWKELGAASKLPVAKVARAWLTKPGFPVLKVSTAGDQIKLTQSRFTMTGHLPGLWPIPVDMLIDGRKKSLFISGRSASVPAKVRSELVVNAGRTGFYSVLYDEAGWERMVRSFPGLSSTDRAGVITDLHLFMQAGLLDPEIYFRFVSLAGQVPDSLATETIVRQLSNLRTIADEAPVLRSAYGKFYAPLIARIGEDARPDEPGDMGSTREALTSEYAKVDLDYARKLASRFEDYSHLDPNLKEAVAVA
ncbi:MAG TPA: M1 family metallopeptidase, partial [Nitrososphaerales archaeon]|nr:M1 family metallopeptidase [Nitrososphaerales archaeon]